MEHARVEQGARCPSLTRLGPYDTVEEAALTLWVRARSREQAARGAAEAARAAHDGEQGSSSRYSSPAGA